MKCSLSKLLLILTLLLLLAPSSCPAQFLGQANHPELKWDVLETDHFKIYYHQGLASFAQRSAEAAESVYGPVTAFYNFEPDEKIRLILKDTDDYANGAAYYYHNTIEIWVTNLDFELRGTTDWLQNVIAHEFTHIVSLQTARKSSRRLPAIYFHYLGYQSEDRRDDILIGYPDIFTTYAVPLTIVPPWFAEGTAQYMAPGAHHDRWDSHRDMVLRMAALNKDLLTYDEMGVFGAKTGIGFEKVYDHGYSLVLFIVNNFGEEKLSEIYRHMTTIWRTDFGGAIKSALGISGRELHRRWVSALEERYQGKERELEPILEEGDLLTDDGYFNFHPAWSPDGKQLAYISNKGSDYGRTSLWLHTLADSTEELAAAGATTAFDWSPDGSHLLFSRRSAPNKYASRLWDIYTVDPSRENRKGVYQKTKATLGISAKLPDNEKRLTRDLRVIHPAYSDDGTRIAFVKNGGGTTNLGVMDVGSGEIAYLTELDDGTQFYTPAWSPDGSQIAVSVFKNGGSRNIALIPATGGEWRPILASTGTDRDPCWTSDGTGLIFSSDQDGIFDLYHLNTIDGAVHRITRVKGGALQPDLDPSDEQIAYSSYGAKGYEIRTVDAKGRWEQVPQDTFRREADPEIGIRPAVDTLATLAERSYTNEFSTLSVFPRLALDAGKPKVGLFAGSNDVLGKQSLFVGGMFARDLDMDLFALYEYRRWRPTIFMEAYRAVRHEADDILNRDENYRIFSQTFTITGVEIGAAHQLSSGGLMDLRFIYNRSGTSQDVAQYNGLNEASISATTLNGFDLAFTYKLRSILRAKDAAVNPRAGREITFRYDRYFNFFISGFKENTSILIETFEHYFYNQFTLDWNEYLPIGPGRSALGLRAYGGFIDKDVDDYFDFFLGGLPFMKGYTFYSLEGRKAAMLRAAYRFPLWTRIDRQTGPIYSDQLYGAIYAGIGRAWDGNADDKILNRTWKRDLGAQIRYDGTSFYIFPTRISFDVAYGLDSLPKVNPGDPLQKSGLRFYFTLLFGYLQSVGHGR